MVRSSSSCVGMNRRVSNESSPNRGGPVSKSPPGRVRARASRVRFPPDDSPPGNATRRVVGQSPRQAIPNHVPLGREWPVAVNTRRHHQDYSWRRVWAGSRRAAEGGTRGPENGPVVAPIPGIFATKSVEVERCKRGLPREDWRLIKSQSGNFSSNDILESYISILLSII